MNANERGSWRPCSGWHSHAAYPVLMLRATGNKNCEIVRCHFCTRKPNSFYCRLIFSTGKKSPGGAGTHTGHTYRY